MAEYKVFPSLLDGYEGEAAAISMAQYLCFEEEATMQTISHARHVETVGDVGVYYCYGADHYFFTDEYEEEA